MVSVALTVVFVGSPDDLSLSLSLVHEAGSECDEGGGSNSNDARARRRDGGDGSRLGAGEVRLAETAHDCNVAEVGELVGRRGPGLVVTAEKGRKVKAANRRDGGGGTDLEVGQLPSLDTVVPQRDDTVVGADLVELDVEPDGLPLASSKRDGATANGGSIVRVTGDVLLRAEVLGARGQVGIHCSVVSTVSDVCLLTPHSPSPREPLRHMRRVEKHLVPSAW